MIVRLLSFCVVAVIGIIAPSVFFAVGAVAYALRYTAYELIVVAGAIDAYYRLNDTALPYYTIVTCVCLLLIEWIKPRISVYND